MLRSLCDHSRTDKDTSHSYMDVYEQLFSIKRESATQVLEIGIGPKDTLNGGSIKLWNDFFPNATIHAIDIISYCDVWDAIKTQPRICLHTESDAYTPEFVNNTFAAQGLKFDIMIDDGPHTLESMKVFVGLYTPLLKDDGVMVIEDIWSMGWISEILACLPGGYSPTILDRRHIKGRGDDIMIVITKTPPS